ncbi:MAG: GNAT family N-acetyltransferase [Candidatus Micrarchaeota archaeon]|nr:GNAT family N-acetyltransferase [Candidatus Micrarchaeota archaeon]
MKSPKLFLRKLTKDDLALVYAWRNDPLIRRFMFNSKKISKAEHMRYWQKRLRKGNCYVISTSSRPFGFAKFDKFAEGYDIGIYIDPTEQGKGYGALALKALKKIAISSGFKPLFARIKLNNLASQKIFKKNGFKAKYVCLECNLA